MNEANAAVQKLAAKLRIAEAFFPDQESRAVIADAILHLKGLSICLLDLGLSEDFPESEIEVQPFVLHGLVDF